MIIVNLKGGLGNQMFQYAFGRKLSLKNDDELKLETAGLMSANKIGDIYRPFSLSQFKIKKQIATPDEVRKLKYPYGILSKALRWFNFKILKKTHTQFEPHAMKKTGDIFLDGYWQSPEYFEDIRETLLEEFTLEEPGETYFKDMANKIKGTESVSIHVRRGDYANNPQVLKEFGICSKEYYQNAVNKIAKKCASPTYFVFSDDIDWVKSNLDLNEKVEFVSNPSLTDAQELILMSTCEHNIIANSTFSWWAAWLNQNIEKMVISPTPWFNNTSYDSTLIPKTWTKLVK